MNYSKHNWTDGELMTADKLNDFSIEVKEGTQYYDEITYDKYLDSTTNTYYSIITVPYLDKNGKRIKIKNGFSGDKFGSEPETILDFKKRHENASLIINAMPWVVETGEIQGRVIADGVALQTSPIAWGNETLGLLPTGELKTYTNSVSINDILAEGVTDGWAGFFSLIVDHEKVDYLSHQTTYPNINAINSHQVIAQMDNLDLKIFTFGGNTKNRPGFTLDDTYRVLSQYNLKFAYNLDGGGSTSTILNGVYTSDLKDDFGRSMRKVPSFIYFEKDDEDLKNVNIVSDDQSVEASKNGNAAYRKVFDDILSPTQDVLNMQLDIKQIPFSDISTILNSLSTYRGTWKNAGGDVVGLPTDTYSGHFTIFEIIDYSSTSGIIRCTRYAENRTWQAGVNAGVISAWKEL